MHIPKTQTAELEIRPFKDLLAEALLPQKNYNSEKWLYVPCRYEEYRYILGTRGKHPLICIGINPSTAAPEDLDNTLKSVERIAFHNGYDSFMMLNLYPQRATDPDDMEKDLNKELLEDNVKALTYLLENSDEPAIWAAWGAIIEKRSYLFDCLAALVEKSKEYHVKWYTCGKRSVKGHPHHPLYLKKDSLLEEFDAEKYASQRTMMNGQ